MLQLLKVLLLALLAAVTEGVNCTAYNQDRCVSPRPIRILFIVDASLSIGLSNFNTFLSDYLIDVFCAFSDDGGGTIEYEAGLVTFNQYVEVKIPFGVYTPETWEVQINSKIRNQVPLKCCTSHAEAAILAKELFSDPSLRDGFENIAFFVTDGLPYSNEYNQPNYGIIKDPASLEFYTNRSLDPLNFTRPSGLGQTRENEINAAYAGYNVPSNVNELLQENLRLFFIGVPPTSGKQVNIGYFNGAETEICFDGSCEPISHRPLVSEPAGAHSFAADVWDVAYLVQNSLDLICQTWVPPSESTSLCRSVQVSPPAVVSNNCDPMPLQPFFQCCADETYTYSGYGKNRTVELFGIWCDDLISGRDCSKLKARKDLLDIHINQTYSSTIDTCGYTCAAYGDPQIVTFDGTREEWILCDARDGTEEFCTNKKEVCMTKTDHNGNPCVWDDGISAIVNEKWPKIQVYGSPCLPDFSRGSFPQMTLYSADQFSLQLFMDERGTIGSVSMQAGGVTYTLDANDCVNDPSTAWTSSSGSIPDSFAYIGHEWTKKRPHRIYENTWKLGDVTSGIIVESQCIQYRLIKGNKRDKARINIMNVFEPDTTRADNSATGVCSTNSISNKNGSPLDPVVEANCPYSDDARVCSVLGNPSCMPHQVKDYAVDWCYMTFANPKDARYCANTIMRSKFGAQSAWSHMYCKAVADAGIANINTCKVTMKQNPQPFVTLVGDGYKPSTCANHYNKYEKRGEVSRCQHGSYVEWQDPNTLAWNEEFFIPANFPPCEGYVCVNGKTFPRLFTRNVRVRQSAPALDCPMEARKAPIPPLKVTMQYSGCTKN